MKCYSWLAVQLLIIPYWLHSSYLCYLFSLVTLLLPFQLLSAKLLFSQCVSLSALKWLKQLRLHTWQYNFILGFSFFIQAFETRWVERTWTSHRKKPSYLKWSRLMSWSLGDNLMKKNPIQFCMSSFIKNGDLNIYWHVPDPPIRTH